MRYDGDLRHMYQMILAELAYRIWDGVDTSFLYRDHLERSDPFRRRFYAEPAGA